MKHHRKALARLHSRAAIHDRVGADGTKRPGSMNRHKGSGTRARTGDDEHVNRSREATPRVSTRPGLGRTRKAPTA
jgi:hypothetical protein